MKIFLYFSQAWYLIKNNKLIWLFTAIYTLGSVGTGLLARFIPANNSGIRVLFDIGVMILGVFFKAGMIYVVYKLCMSDAILGKDFWFGVKTYWFRLFLWGQLWVLVAVGLYFLFVPFLPLLKKMSFSDFICISIPVGVVILTIAAGLSFFGPHCIVIKNLNISQSIKPSLRLLWRNLFSFIGFSLVSHLIIVAVFLFGAFIVAPLASGVAYESGENILEFSRQLSSAVAYRVFIYSAMFIVNPYISAASTVAYIDYATIKLKEK